MNGRRDGHDRFHAHEAYEAKKLKYFCFVNTWDRHRYYTYLYHSLTHTTHKYTQTHTPRGLGWRIYYRVAVTELTTNKRHISSPGHIHTLGHF